MNFLYAFYGSFAYALLIWAIAKNQDDAKSIDFSYRTYCKRNVDNWLVTIAFAPILVLNLPDIIAIINERTDWSLKMYNIYYWGTGVFVELLYVGVAILFKWKAKFIPTTEK